MALCAAIWLFLLFVGISFGLLTLRLLSSEEETINIFLESPLAVSFIGIILLCNLLLCISFLIPLRFYHLTFLEVLCISVILHAFSVNNFVEAFYSFLRKNAFLALFSIVASFSFINHDYDKSCDMITYHAQMARYLHLYGSTKGIALISAQLGHASPWFALPAALESILEIYSSLAVGSFTIFISFFQLMRSAFHIARDRYEIFLFSYFALSIPYLNIQVQPTSVENALNILIGFAFFHAIKLLDKAADAEASPGSPKSLTKDGRSWMVITLSASALSLKLTGLPAFLLCAYVIFIRARSFLKWSACADLFLILSAFILPRPTASAILSGCPFYPSSLFHLPVPWFAGQEFSEKLIKYIIVHAKWGSEYAPPVENFIQGLIAWSKIYGSQTVIYLMCVTAFSIIISFFLLGKSLSILLLRYKILIAIQFIGLLYILLVAPNSRFAPPYIVVIFSTFITMIFYSSANKSLFAIIASFSLSELVLLNIKIGLMYAVLFILLLILSYINSGIRLTHSLVFICCVKVIASVFYFLPFSFITETSNHPLLTPNVSSFENTFTSRSINGITYYMPENSQGCGYSPLPCVTNYRLHFEIPIERIKLIDQSKGVAGGFRLAPENQAAILDKEWAFRR